MCTTVCWHDYARLVVDHRGVSEDMVYLSDKSRRERCFSIPLAELMDFFDQLKKLELKAMPRDYEFDSLSR